ncbi:SUF system Fe-S cluster assembly regulator [Govanella unica]|uniref:SUF system Fe-S cluster assembly regulator n=1 Tax=Govanella unica TaxID=2975056 RepID=A0A9X3Z5W3_9PROT|nr:SUF system Fe-S cluster assembly regulator [Govania unica]MDA5192393.1 SUF system Fe-S cluster assembly regulator [Govania unica]
MIRLTKLADYAVVLMAHMAENPGAIHSASGIAAATLIPAPTVSKILGAMARSGLLKSHRGLNGGFELAHEPQDISIAHIVSVVDGPIALTDCTEESHMECDILGSCHMPAYWRKINGAIRHALEGVTLSDLTQTLPDFLAAFPSPEDAKPTEDRHDNI